jgi:hypothetical protein
MVRLVRQENSTLETPDVSNEMFLDVSRNVFNVRTDGVESPSITSFQRELGRRLHGCDGLPDFS